MKDDGSKDDWYIGKYLDSQIPNDMKKMQKIERSHEIKFSVMCIFMIIIGILTILSMSST